jgi:hypothetical protein
VKRTYQINKERALQKFNAAAKKAQQEIQFALPLAEVMPLIGQGLTVGRAPTVGRMALNTQIQPATARAKHFVP